MIRPSSLAIARFCQLSPVLSERFPHRSEATDRGSAVDAQASAAIAGGPEATDADAKAVTSWVAEALSGHWTRVQVPVELYDPASGGLITKGTADLVAFREEDRHLTVLDFKKREQLYAGRLSEPDDNDQLHAYALGEALRLEADTYQTVLLLFGDGEVEARFSQVYDSRTWAPILERIRSIQLDQEDDPRPTSGDHCARCWPREHCPSWVLPAHQGPTELEALTTPGGLTLETAPRALMAVLALQEVVKKAKERLQGFARDNGGAIVVGDRRWAPVEMPGRPTADVKALEAAGLSQYVRRGAPYEQWRWGKR